MADRYFLECAPSGDEALLAGSEAHHLAHVMRAKPGERVVLFDGSGCEYTAQVEHVGRSEIRLTIEERRQHDRELACQLVLGVALPKGDRQRYLVEKAVELGVQRLVPLVTQHSAAQPAGQAITRLARSVIEASKQCGRNRLMQIDQPELLAQYLSAAPADAVKLIAHPGENGSQQVRAALDAAAEKLSSTDGVWLAVGPEGGFSDDEVRLAQQQGWQAVSLGERILRIETAALFLAAAVASRV